MSDAEEKTLADEARALLASVRDPPATPPDVRARALRRLELALPLLPASIGPAPQGATSPTSTVARLLAKRVPAWTLGVGFAAGGLVGAATIRAVAPRPAPVLPAPSALATVNARASDSPSSSVDVPAATGSASAPLAAPPPTASAVATSRPVASPPRTFATSVSDALPAESALLDVARTALGRGDGANALAATDAHAKKFPRGALSEEREAIRIQALRMLHRDDEANAKLDRFRARFPTSLLRPALEAPEGGGDAGGR